MKNFYRNCTWCMLLLISIGVGFSGNVKFSVGGYNAFLTIKAFLLLVIILTLASFPELIILFQSKNRKEVKHE
ncbi:hypothetical protein [Lactococcus lactis]|uniref:hypothetical protein n=1 Tax=Lactococcus lactis TaxID=1358 RepID=UPI00117AF055|nr:hypothetical protein [Lactococcus lactis]MBR8673596.1 hypothetical protein [Lactococcus lactis subsp. lactis]MBR8676501.1 hypothetical protein [Lactococcus lactis subsp. lactis]MBR8683986.1 hypothetical protein [Lactococcus lactis subsp. lactis]MCH5427458.1 hypothetical protein [Lactococcus lactis]MCT0078789.1 hypothetical protein [Lactococcus lactis subsp. lactis]